MALRNRLGRADLEQSRSDLAIRRYSDCFGNDWARHRADREDDVDGVVTQRSINVTRIKRHDGDFVGSYLVLFEDHVEQLGIDQAVPDHADAAAFEILNSFDCLQFLCFHALLALSFRTAGRLRSRGRHDNRDEALA